MSRHRSLVATSLNAFAGFNWSLLMSRHQYLVATSAQVFCSLPLVVHDVATSSSCRDISLCLWRFHWLLSVSRQQLQLNHLHPSKPVIVSRRFSSRDLSSLVATSAPLSRHHPCRDITMLSRHHSLSFWLILSCLSGDSCSGQLLISFNYLDVATS